MSFILDLHQSRNSATSWRVAGWLHGVRIRKNLPAREEAAAETAALEVKTVQAASGLRPALTCLTDQQLRKAEPLFRAVADRKRGVTFSVNVALSNYRDPEHEKSLEEGQEFALHCGRPRKHTADPRTDNSPRSAASCGHPPCISRRPTCAS
jgi:hypothetical protein